MITFDRFGIQWGDYIKNGRGKGVSCLGYRPSVPPVACSEMGSSPSAWHSSTLSPGQAGHRTGSMHHRTHVEWQHASQELVMRVKMQMPTIW